MMLLMLWWLGFLAALDRWWNGDIDDSDTVE